MTDDADPTGPQVAPYGTWASPLGARVLAAGAVRLTDLRTDGGDVLWIETRPAEGGRHAVVRWRAGATTEVTPPGFNARTRVHEYGGGAYAVHGGVVVASRWEDQRLYRLDGAEPAPLTPAPPVAAGWRYADATFTPDGRHLVAVREDHTGGGEPRNELVVLAADGGDPVVIATGHDFYASPAIAPDGRRIAYLHWDHPAMPWDAATLTVGTFDPDHGIEDERDVLGGGDEAAFQPCWTADGDLLATTDRSGFWNVHRVEGGASTPLTAVAADIGHPHWQFGDASIAPLPDGRVVCAAVERARSWLGVLPAGGGELEVLDLPYTRISQLRPGAGGVAFLAQSPDVEDTVVRLPVGGDPVHLREVDSTGLDAEDRPRPEAITFPTPDGGEAHAFLYRPRNRRFRGPDGERPPLLVATHGGPTGNVFPVLTPAHAFWTTRGFAVVDVNYRGSTGFGREYRDALKGRWGELDVMDTIAAARFLAERGEVDPARMAIRGGSAGGFTTLAALVEADNPFAAGADHFGVADITALAQETHKFESRYGDQLVGPYPEEAERYRDRSPITHVDRLSTPVIVLQGSEDEVVPPAQSERIVAAARERGVPHAYLLFEGEQHGFRRAENIARALEAELAFYAAIMGFEPADDLEPLEIVGLDR